MAKSLAKIKEQIARLQKEADSIQSTVIARLKREIAQHGLTAEHLFSSTDSTVVDNASKTAAKRPKAASAKKAGIAKPAKYADAQGNAWHGIGKRPQWIHEALNAGGSLTDFLIGAKKATPTVTASSAIVKAASKAPRKAAKKVATKVASTEKPAPAKRAAKAEVAAKPAGKTPAKRKAGATPAKKSPAKKPSKVKAATSSTDLAQAKG